MTQSYGPPSSNNIMGLLKQLRQPVKPQGYQSGAYDNAKVRVEGVPNPGMFAPLDPHGTIEPPLQFPRHQ